MSDRINELVLTCPLTQLATIAREAEAMCEWLAGEIAMARDDTINSVLDAAREAVQNER